MLAAPLAAAPPLPRPAPLDPRIPADGDGEGVGAAAAVVSERFKKRIRRAVIDLPDAAEGGGERREQQEEVELFAAEQRIEDERPSHLRGKDAGCHFRGLQLHDAASRDARRMNHPMNTAK